MRLFKSPSTGLLPICLVAALVFAGGCRLFPKEDVEAIPELIQPPSEDLITHRIIEGPIAEELQAYARVGSGREQQIYFPVNGRIKEVDIHLGDMVKKGQLLMSLEKGELDFSIKQAKLALEQEQLQYQQQFGENSDLNRSSRLAKFDVDQTQERLDQAKQDLAAVDASADGDKRQKLQDAVEQAQKDYDDSVLSYGQRQKNYNLSLRLVQLGIEKAQTECDRLARELENSIIRAPFAGKIIAVSAIRGRNVEAFEQMAIIADMRGLEMIANLAVKDANRIRPGMGVRVKIDQDEPRTGKITVVEQVETSQPGSDEWVARIRMDDPRFPLKLDDFYTVSFVLRFAAKAMLVPNDAVREDVNGRKYLRVLEGKRRRDAYVKVGIEGETQTQILEGAKLGMVVIGK
jgi:HlyD family secretion protein